MTKHIAWFTFVLVSIMATNLFRRQSVDQRARNLAGISVQKMQILERSGRPVTRTQIADLTKITDKLKAQEASPMRALE